MKKILIVASSLDGYIARERGQISTAWTSQADRQWFSKITREIGVMLMGRRTYDTIDRVLPGRATVVLTRSEEFSARWLEEFPQVAGDQFDWAGKLEEERLYKTGERTPAEIIEALAAKGVEQVAICGGASVYQSFLAAEQVDEIYLTIEPVFLGEGIKLFESDLGEAFPLQLEVVEKFELSLNTSVWHLVLAGCHCQVNTYPRIFEWLDSIQEQLTQARREQGEANK